MMQRDWLGVCGAVVLAASAMWTTSCIEEVPLQSELAARLVEEVCSDDCGCGGSRCEEWANQEGERLTNLAEAMDLTFDEDCFASRLQIHEAKQCRPKTSDHEYRCGVRCSLLHGDRKAGQSCSTGGGESTCAQGLLCQGAICVDPCDSPDVGQPCRDGGCAAPAVCDFSTDLCVALPGAGEPCLNNACDGGLSCIAGTCSGPRDNGEECMGHDHCASGNCPAGYCAARPLLGESCRGQVPCAEGLECEDEVCVEGSPPGSPCPCRSGMTCDNGVCRYNDPSLQCGGYFLVY